MNSISQNCQKQHHFKVLLNSFHLNDHTLGFHPQTEKVQPHLLTQGLTLGVKGLNINLFCIINELLMSVIIRDRQESLTQDAS